MQDRELVKLIEAEEHRQKNGLCMIASENYVSRDVREATSSVLTNKYSEGYPGKRYYTGNQFVDEVEMLAINRAKKIFGAEHVNVQPYSGTVANMEIYFALLKQGGRILAMNLEHGGHISHGLNVSFAGRFYEIFNYGVDKNTHKIALEEVERLAVKYQPELIICGATAYPRKIYFKEFARIAKKIGAFLLTDISHVAGLVATGLHPSPFPDADVVMTTTHKTLRGPRGALIMCKKALAEQIDRAIFPGMQGGPHNQQTASIAMCLYEAMQDDFQKYAEQIIKNSQALATALIASGFSLVTGGSDNHLILMDVSKNKLTGDVAADLLAEAMIFTNKNLIPYDTGTAKSPSGIRLGTAALTTRGMKENEMQIIAKLLARILLDKENPHRVKSDVWKLTEKL